MEENIIYEDETEELNAPKTKIGKKISIEFLMIFIIGILLGIVIKTEAGKRINVADKNFYGAQAYDFEQIINDLTEKK